eukprot:1317040-Prymnesium_polylepis.1
MSGTRTAHEQQQRQKPKAPARATPVSCVHRAMEQHGSHAPLARYTGTGKASGARGAQRERVRLRAGRAQG